MKVLQKAAGVVSAHEVYTLVTEDLARIPIQDSQLSQDELHRRFLSLSVIEYVERHSVVPPLDEILSVTSEAGRQALEVHGVGKAATHIVPRARLEELLDTLHARYQLSQAELMQIVDVAPLQLVDLYAIIESCTDRYNDEIVSEMLKEIRATLALDEYGLETPSEIAEL